MGNKMKKLICALLASAMLVSSVGMVAFADEVDTTITSETAPVAEETTEATEAPADTEATEETTEATEAPAEATEAPAEATEAPAATQAPVTGTAYDNDAYYQKALALCSALGIITGYEDGSIKPDSKVTRAEMASIVLRMLNTKSMSAYQNGFTDVTSAHWAADTIQTAQEAAVINGMGDGTFAPDGEVTYAQIVVMLVNALNYKQDAEYYGGWQAGYMKVGSELDLLKNAPGSNDVASERGVVIKMVYNALLADYKDIVRYENGVAVYDSKETLSEAKFDLIEEKGILTGTEKTSIGDEVQPGQISIEPENEEAPTLYNCALTGLEEYIAQKVTYYYKENSGLAPEVYAVTFDPSKSDSVEIDIDDVEEITGFESGNGKIKLNSSNRAKNCEGAKIIYNGKMMSVEDYDAAKNEASAKEIFRFGNDINDFLLPEVGSIKLVDSGKDDKYDVVFVDSYETMIISNTSTDRITGKVSVNDINDVKKTETIAIDLDDDIDRVVTVKREGMDVKVRNLKKNDLASIKRSIDDTVVDIIVTGESVTGKATGMSVKYDRSYATVDGKRYDVANVATENLKTGAEGTFYLDMFGRIGHIEVSASGRLQSGEKYGWIMNAYKSEDGSSHIVDMMTQEGKAVEMKLNKTVDFWQNGSTENVEKSAEEIMSVITKKVGDDTVVNNDAFLKMDSTPIRLVKYKANSSNAITRLYCAVNLDFEDYKDALIINPRNLTGIAVAGGFIDGYSIADGLLEISVPLSADEMNDAKNYKFGEVSSSAYVVRGDTGTSRDYVIGEFVSGTTPTLLINFTESLSALASTSGLDTNGNNPVMLVQEVSTGVDDEDNKVYTMTGFVNGVETSVTTTENAVLAEINAAAQLINNDRQYSVKSYNGKSYRWDARNGDASGKGEAFTDIVSEGDLVLYDTSCSRFIKLLDADDVYATVITNKDDVSYAKNNGLLFGGFNPFPARNMFVMGGLLNSDVEDNAWISLGSIGITPSGAKGATAALEDMNVGTMQFDSSRVMDTVEIDISSGEATIYEDGSTIADLVNFDKDTRKGDFVFARYVDKGNLQEVIVFRFVD